MTSVAKAIPLDLQDFDAFRNHPWITGLEPRIEKDTSLAQAGMNQLLHDLREINGQFIAKTGVTAFVAIDGRVKAMDSTLRKLQYMCSESAKKNGISRDLVENLYSKINDLCGVRFSCPYFDEIVSTVNEYVLPSLHKRGYGVDLSDNHPCKDNLDKGDDSGYRSYHFFVLVPAPINIFADTEPVLCEVQARSELQHIWAVKSHELLYKPEEGWAPMDEHVRSDMRAVSEGLRAADQWLVSIRDRAKGGGDN